MFRIYIIKIQLNLANCSNSNDIIILSINLII